MGSAVEVNEFTNAKGQQIQYLSIYNDGMRYPLRIGIAKAKVIIVNADEVAAKLKELGKL